VERRQSLKYWEGQAVLTVCCLLYNASMSSDNRPFLKKYLPASATACQWGIKDHEGEIEKIVHHYAHRYEAELPLVISNSVMSNRNFCDRRTPQMYFYDLLNGWIVQDFAKIWLVKNLAKFGRIVVECIGTDSDRVVQMTKPEKVTTDPDFSCSLYDIDDRVIKSQNVEIQISEQIRFEYDMKATKIESARVDGTIFLWFVPAGGFFFFCDPRTDLAGCDPWESRAWLGKMVYSMEANKIKCGMLCDKLSPDSLILKRLGL